MSPPFMQLYVGDYLRGTLGLSTEQHGAHLLLLMALWNSGGELPNDDRQLARIARLSTGRWLKISGPIKALYQIDNGRLANRRLSEELAKANAKSHARAQSGSRGGRATALNSKGPAAANADDLLQHLPEPEPDSFAKVSGRRAAYSLDFEAFWDRYPKKRAKPDAYKAFKTALGATPGPDALATLICAVAEAQKTRQWRDGFIPHPATWLRQSRWLDEFNPETDYAGPHRFASTRPSPRQTNLHRAAESAARVAGRQADTEN